MENIIFIPGIKGSQLYEGSHKRWYPSTFKDFEALKMTNNLTPGAPTARITIPKIGESFDIYEGFLREFGERHKLSSFTYDWRQSILDHLSRLDELVQSIDGPITIIAHSMGGLIAKAYLLDMDKEERKKKIKQFISIGTPWRGAPDAYKALILGEPLIAEDDRKLQALNIYRDKEVMNFAREFPSTYQLLPSKEYHQSEGGQFLKGEDSSYSTWDEIINTLNFNDEVNPYFQKYALPIHKLMTLPLDVKNYALIGYGIPTLKVMSKKSKGRIGFKTNSKFWNGDYVVPIMSAEPPHESNVYYIKGEHKLLTSLPSTLKWINWILNGLNGSCPVEVSNDKEVVNVNIPWRGTEAIIMCPVGFTLKDNEGNSLAGDLDPESINLDKLKEKEEMYIHTVGNAKYLFLQRDSEHSIDIDPYSKGIVNVSVADFEEGEEKVTIFETVPVDEGTVLTLELPKEESNSSPKLTKNTRERKKKTVATVTVKSIPEEFSDKPLPSFDVELISGEGGKRNRALVPVFSGDVILNITGDIESLLEIFWVLNDGVPHKYEKNCVIPAHEGENQVTIFARDQWGRVLEEKTLKFKVDTKAPITIPLIEYNPDGGVGIGARVAEETIGIKETKFRWKRNNGKYSDWFPATKGSKSFFNFEEVFGSGEGSAILEYYSVDKFDRKEEVKSLKLSIGRIREKLWGTKTKSVTAIELWNEISSTAFQEGKVSILKKTYSDIKLGDKIPDDSRKVKFATRDLELTVGFSEYYKLYWSGPPKEVVKRGIPYNFSFQLLTDYKYAVMETEPEVRYYPYPSSTTGGGRTVNIEPKDDAFSGSFSISKDFKADKIKLVVRDNKHKSPPLRETILIIED